MFQYCTSGCPCIGDAGFDALFKVVSPISIKVG